MVQGPHRVGIKLALEFSVGTLETDEKRHKPPVNAV